ncbi:MAG: hypothetical protein LBB83_02740 [Treponema sp.]|jgi:hypothetical protein|nr:hypothetical protein [Treponema sp.]
MSKSKESGEAEFASPAGQVPPETPEYPGGEDVAENPAERVPPESGGEPDLQTIEEYAKTLKTGKPILAAIMEAERWAAGKKVTEDVFKTAVDTFLNGPMNGERNAPKEKNNGTA